RPGLLRKHCAGPEDRLCTEEQLRLRRDQRHAGLQARLNRGMHAAPSVRYPVARSPAAGWLLAAAWTAGALAAGWWTWQASAPDWRQGGALILSLATGVVGLLAWRHAPAGALAWDGATWTLQQHSGEAATG